MAPRAENNSKYTRAPPLQHRDSGECNSSQSSLQGSQTGFHTTRIPPQMRAGLNNRGYEFNSLRESKPSVHLRESQLPTIDVGFTNQQPTLSNMPVSTKHEMAKQNLNEYLLN
jgi:hypothetical protein